MAGRPPHSPLRVLHCPTFVGGNPGSLARAEREIGLDSWAVSFDPVHDGYEMDEVLWPPGTGRIRRELARWRLLRRASGFDVVHFNFGSTIFPRAFPELGLASRLYARALEFRDVRKLKRAGTGIVVTYQGDDARQYGTTPLDRRKREWIGQFDRYADRIYALNPDLLRVLPPRSKFLPYAHIDLDDWQPVAPREGGGPLRLVHAPSNPEVKGTRWVLEAVEQLRADGLEVELDLVQGPISRNEARPRYERADLAIDQLLIGWYGGLAVELMALGKPVVCHLRDEDLDLIPPAMRAELPLVRATPESLAGVLREWAGRPRSELHELGRRGRAYVERWHDRRDVAARLKTAYEEIVAR